MTSSVTESSKEKKRKIYFEFGSLVICDGFLKRNAFECRSKRVYGQQSFWWYASAKDPPHNSHNVLEDPRPRCLAVGLNWIQFNRQFVHVCRSKSVEANPFSTYFQVMWYFSVARHAFHEIMNEGCSHWLQTLGSFQFPSTRSFYKDLVGQGL